MLPMKQVLSRVAKGPAPGTLIAMQLLTLAPKPVPASSPTATLLLPSTLASSASSPIAVLKDPVVLKNMASSPIALFWLPVLFRSALRPCALLKNPLTLLNSANAPTALLSAPSLLFNSAPAPTAVLVPPLSTRSAAAPTPVSKLASLKDKTDKKPKAELYRPVVRLPRAPCPSAVLLVETEPGSGVSVALRTCWQSAKQTSADRTVPNIIFRLFIIYFLSLFLAFPDLSLPRRLLAKYFRRNPAPAGRGWYHRVSFLAVCSFSSWALWQKPRRSVKKKYSNPKNGGWVLAGRRPTSTKADSIKEPG